MLNRAAPVLVVEVAPALVGDRDAEEDADADVDADVDVTAAVVGVTAAVVGVTGAAADALVAGTPVATTTDVATTEKMARATAVSMERAGSAPANWVPRRDDATPDWSDPLTRKGYPWGIGISAAGALEPRVIVSPA